VNVFDDEFVTDLQTRFEDRPQWERPDLWFVAVAPQRRALREWIDAEVAWVPEPGRSKLVSRLRDDANFLTAYHELAAAAALRDAGLAALYEPDINGLSPDLLVPSGPDGHPILAEVWTRSLPREAKGERRSWNALRDRLAQIPVPVGLLVTGVSGARLEAPTSKQAKQVSAALHGWLAEPRRRGEELAIHGYLFRVWGELPGGFAHLAAPASGGVVDSDITMQAISEKVKRYAALARELDAHLMVVAASDPSAPLDLELLRAVLAGRQSFAFSFSAGSSGLLGQWSGRMLSSETPATFDPALSAVGWLAPGVGDPLLTLLPMSSAGRALPNFESARITYVSH